MPRHSDLAELLGVSPRELMQVNTVRQDRYDARLYGELLAASPKLANLACQEPQTWPPLLQDVWAAFYKASPELVPENRLDPAYRVNRTFAGRLLEDKTTAEVRLTTMLDELAAGLATIEAGERLLEEIKKRPELQQAMEQAAEALQAQEEGNEQQAEALAATAAQGLQQAARELRRAVRVAAEAGQQKAEQVRKTLAGWGLEPADLQRVPLADRIKLVERLTGPDMRHLAVLIGRLRNLARARQKERLKRDRDEIHGITLGTDLGRVLPAELAMLRHPLRKLDFYRRFTERQLLQYELRSREPVGRGPMICLVDASGSMHGRKIDWASAVTLALVDTAIRQKRRAAVIHFNAKVIQKVEFAPGEGRDVEKLVAVATVAADGGTDYVPPLTQAVKLIKQVGYEKADICMITDGECEMGAELVQQFLAVKKRLGFRCWSVLIDGAARELGKWSDRVWPVRDLTNEAAGELFEAVY